jgi:flagellar hook assembly protein FlgD
VYPSPFTDNCRIVLRPLHQPAAATLTVNDVTGRIVRRLSVQATGAGSTAEILWDGRGDDGRLLPSGVYLVRLANSREASAGRVILAR